MEAVFFASDDFDDLITWRLLTRSWEPAGVIMAVDQLDRADSGQCMKQHTLLASIGCVGVGLHSGVKSTADAASGGA